MSSQLKVLNGLGNDLPPAWDGEPVTWYGWSNLETTVRFHASLDDLTCRECGAIDESSINTGARYCEKHGHPVRDLFAFRCRHCKHDQVWDARTNELWDLDASDYSDHGSYELGQGELL